METEEFLAHYGVKGMKWGVRKDRAKSTNRAFRRATKKARRLSKRANKFTVRGTKRQMRGARRNNQKLHFKGLRDAHKGAKYQAKLDKWERAMREVFSEVDVSVLDDKTRAKGADYLYMLMNGKGNSK